MAEGVWFREGCAFVFKYDHILIRCKHQGPDARDASLPPSGNPDSQRFSDSFAVSEEAKSATLYDVLGVSREASTDDVSGTISFAATKLCCLVSFASTGQERPLHTQPAPSLLLANSSQ